MESEEKKDYIGDEGLLRCGMCGEKKECVMEFNGKEIKTGIACKCEIEAEQKIKSIEEGLKITRMRTRGIPDEMYQKHRFSKDDGREENVSNTCKRYVENFSEMKKENIGIIFFGGVGTGKSFLACCIANALIDKQIPVTVTTLPRLLNADYDEKQEMMDDLLTCDLVVIDDLGVERDTNYSAEQIYNIIDTRLKSGKPLIVTTNLTAAEMKNPQSLTHTRIYDRILDMCPIRLNLTGKSRRAENTKARQELAKKLLAGGRNDL